MAKTSVKAKAGLFTHEGAVAAVISPEMQLRRSVLSCMLFEDNFYEDGVSIAERIAKLSKQLPFEKVADIAIEAREKMKLRHVPLWLAVALARPNMNYGRKLGDLISRIVQRPDEITEFLALFAKHYGRTGTKVLGKLPNQVKAGLARSFGKFNEYALAKHGEDDTQIKLRDALFLCHAKPKDEKQAALFKKIVDGTLEIPDTWEVAISKLDKKSESYKADVLAAWVRLLEEKKLGALAFLRNLRNMEKAGVSKTLVAEYATKIDISRVLPFRFISAANAIPQWEDVIEPMMFRALEGQEKFPGKTIILIDGSASMSHVVSAKSDISRRDAASALAILFRELCADTEVYGFSSQCWQIAPRRGFALRDEINKKVIPAGTLLGAAVKHAQRKGEADRIIVITDEQSSDKPENPKGLGYVINVAAHANGIGYGKWMHIDGWSEAVIDFIRQVETAEAEVVQ